MLDELQVLTRRFERERRARKAAEEIAETKSRELYLKSQEVQQALAAEQQARAEIQALLGEVERLSVTDPLTGLYNRRYLDAQGGTWVTLAARHGHPLSVQMIDLDHFKRVNDTHGHAAGDEVLRTAATLLKAGTRQTDLCARFGGEELCVVLPNTDPIGAVTLARRFIAALAATPFQISDGDRFNVTASVGVAGLSPDGDSLETLLKRADAALYRAKEGGRNRVVCDGSPVFAGDGGVGR